MITNLAQFNRQVRDLAKNLPAEVVKTVQDKLSLDALSGVVQKTPVDTGRAKGGWQVGVNEMLIGDTGRLDPSGQATIASESPKIEAAPPYAQVNITNSVEYIEPLENGHSDQAAHGMVAMTIEELMSQFR